MKTRKWHNNILSQYPSPLKVDRIYDSPSSQNPHSTIKVSLRGEVLSQFKYQSIFEWTLCEIISTPLDKSDVCRRLHSKLFKTLGSCFPYDDLKVAPKAHTKLNYEAECVDTILIGGPILFGRPPTWFKDYVVGKKGFCCFVCHKMCDLLGF